MTLSSTSILRILDLTLIYPLYTADRKLIREIPANEAMLMADAGVLIASGSANKIRKLFLATSEAEAFKIVADRRNQEARDAAPNLVGSQASRTVYREKHSWCPMGIWQHVGARLGGDPSANKRIYG